MSAADLLGRPRPRASPRPCASGASAPRAVIEASIARIERTDGVVNAFTDRTFERARRRAAQLDARLAARDADAAVAACRCSACRSRSRTCSTSPA